MNLNRSPRLWRSPGGSAVDLARIVAFYETTDDDVWEVVLDCGGSETNTLTADTDEIESIWSAWSAYHSVAAVPGSERP
jgi:hypothetical protein